MAPVTRPVLVVDDDDDYRALLRTDLQRRSFAVLDARDGRQALDYLRAPDSMEPCCIVLDLAMPVMTGWELLRHLEFDPRLRHIPVVVLTIFPATVGATSMHYQAWLTKPQPPDRIATAILEAVSAAGSS
jgi:CheY-like chemotaxis protein